MENQHRRISGYRELTQEEIDLMNRIKAKGQELLDLQEELLLRLSAQMSETLDWKGSPLEGIDPAEATRFLSAEPFKWASVGKTDIQTGIMALVRAVAQPTTC